MRHLLLALSALALSGCLGIDAFRDQLKASSDAGLTARTYATTSGPPSARQDRLALLTQAALIGDLRRNAVRNPNQDPYDLARDILCSVQDERLLGVRESRNASEITAAAQRHDHDPGDTLIGNLSALGGGTPEVGTPDDAPHTASEVVLEQCKTDLRSASDGHIHTANQEANILSLGLDLADTIDGTVKPKAVALLQTIVRAQQLRNLRSYLRENHADIDQLQTDLEALNTQLALRSAIMRRQLAWNYLMAFDALSHKMRTRPARAADPMSVLAQSVSPLAVDLESDEDAKKVLDAAADYDAALSEQQTQAYSDLSRALEQLQNIESGRPTPASQAAALRSGLAFANAIADLGEATHDPALVTRANALRDALFGDRSTTAGRSQ